MSFGMWFHEGGEAPVAGVEPKGKLLRGSGDLVSRL